MSINSVYFVFKGFLGRINCNSYWIFIKIPNCRDYFKFHFANKKISFPSNTWSYFFLNIHFASHFCLLDLTASSQNYLEIDKICNWFIFALSSSIIIISSKKSHKNTSLFNKLNKKKVVVAIFKFEIQKYHQKWICNCKILLLLFTSNTLA